MKRCPKCSKTYTDETLNFCLEDGEWLVDGTTNDEPATAILVSEPPTRVHSAPETSSSDKVEKASVLARKWRLMLGVIGVLLIAALGLGAYWLYGNRAGRQIDSIAVMPFLNQSGSPDLEYLSDGMTETLLDSLSQLPGLNVKARSTVFRYKDKDVDAQTVGRELDVRAILNGRVVQRGDGLSLFLELVDTGTGNRIWGGQYDRKQSELVSLQSEIARDVADKLRAKLSGEDTKRLGKSNTANPEAYNLYLQGRFFWNKRRIESMGKAISFFQKAIDLDPNYAKAYAGLADAIAQPSDVVPFSEREEKARAAAQRALSLDNDLAEAHTALAHILLRFNADFAGAERELTTSIGLDPKWIDTYQRYCELYTALGRHDEALAKCREGLEREPFNIPLNAAYGAGLTYARRYDEAIDQLKKTIELDPDHRNAHIALAVVYGLKRMYAEAVEHRVIALKISDQNQWADLIREGFARDGWPGVLAAELERFEQRGVSADRLPHYNKGVLLAALGEKDAAFAELEESLQSHEQPSLVFLKTDPRFDPLRNDQRFNELLKRIGFPD